MKDFDLEKLMEEFYGPSKILRKTVQVSEAATAAGSRTLWEPVYGKKVWSILNQEANLFAILPKEPWVKTGWRVLTGRASVPSGGAVAEGSTGGAIPTPATLGFKEVMAAPKTIAHPFDISELAEFLGSVDDAVDLLPTYREEFGLQHAYDINQMLGKLVEDGAATNSIESIDRVVSNKDEADNTDIGDGEDDIYSQDRDAESATTLPFFSHVVENEGTDRDLTLTLIDTCLQSIWEGSTTDAGASIAGGGKPKVIATKSNTLMRWQQLLEAERRFMDTARVVPTFGGVRGPAPGVEAGFMVATYFGIPIIPSQHVQNRDTIGAIYMLDTDYLKFAVAKPTTYVETAKGQGFLYRGYFATEGMYETMGELRCYRFNVHGKVVDLK